MRFQTILFDLDGTLTDPGLGITNSILYAMEQLGMALPPREALYQFIGPPLLEEFQKVFGVSRETSETMLRHFRVYFADRGIYENSVYPGIPEMLNRLRAAGCRLILATSKPEMFAEQVLAHFDLLPAFSAVCGSDIDETRTAKDAVIAYALASASVGELSRTIMVGDRRHDMVGGKANGLATMGVLYGYGSREELTQSGADFLAPSVEDVAEMLLNLE